MAEGSKLIIIKNEDHTEAPVEFRERSVACGFLHGALEVLGELATEKEDPTEIIELHNYLMGQCDQHCSGGRGCQIEQRGRAAIAGFEIPSSPGEELYEAYADILCDQALRNDGLIGVLGRAEEDVIGVAETRLTPAREIADQEGWKVPEVTKGAYQLLTELSTADPEIGGINLRVMLAALGRAMDISRATQLGEELGYGLRDMAEQMDLSSTKSITRAQIRVIFDNPDFKRWVDMAHTPKDQLLRPNNP